MVVAQEDADRIRSELQSLGHREFHNFVCKVVEFPLLKEVAYMSLGKLQIATLLGVARRGYSAYLSSVALSRSVLYKAIHKAVFVGEGNCRRSERILINAVLTDLQTGDASWTKKRIAICMQPLGNP